MPILLPVRVRRSMRDTTVAATRPAVAPSFTARANSAQGCTRSFFSTRRNRRADGPTGRSRRPRIRGAAVRPAARLDLRQHDLFARCAAAEQFALTDRRRFMRALRATRARHRRRAKTRARFFSNASNAPAAARLSSTRLLTARGLTRAGEIGEIGELPVAARGNDRFDRLLADALERRERIDDGVAVDFEVDRRAVDRRRIDLDAEPFGFGAEFGELVGIAHVERHGRRQELDRIVRLHVGGLIGDQRVGRGVAFVEAVFGEAFEQIEDRVGLVALDAALDRAGDETLALRLHLLADLLAHGAAQQIGFAEREAGEDLRGLHHLLLVDDDAEGLAQDRLELGMDVVRLLHARACARNRSECSPSGPDDRARPAR